jgi:hypothetical protein
VRWSESFIPTLRDAPADAEAISHKLLVRAGFVRQLMSAAAIVDSPVEKVSLLQSVLAFLDRTVDLLPDAFHRDVHSIFLRQHVSRYNLAMSPFEMMCFERLSL